MAASDFITLWKHLEEVTKNQKEIATVYRRISPDIPHDIFLGYEKTTNQRLFILRVGRKNLNEFEQLPEFRIFQVSIDRADEGKPEKATVNFCLKNLEYSDFFSILCEDLYSTAIREINPTAMVKQLKSRLLLWKQFLDTFGHQGLSPEAQRGLYGELRFLRDILIEHLDITNAIESWRGPAKANQDFQFLKIGVEVKTSIAKQHQKIHVANEQQLDDNNLDTLYVYFLSLRETRDQGETLPGIIDHIRKIIELKYGPSDEFETLLFKAGYIDKHKELYLKTGYHDREILIFDVRENFPRIIETDLKPGVGDVHYSIDLSICRQYRISVEDFISDLEWMKNDYR